MRHKYADDEAHNFRVYIIFNEFFYFTKFLLGQRM